MTPNATHFQQLLNAAAAQPEPQRLLFVFAAAELPDDANPEQRRRFEAGRGGALVPLACVDKDPAELGSWAALVTESRQASPPWQVVFIAGLPGRGGRPPPARDIDTALEKMVGNIRQGRFSGYMALKANGEPLAFS
jgi:hypothetical protein